MLALVTDNASNMTLAEKKMSEDLSDERKNDGSDTEQKSTLTQMKQGYFGKNCQNESILLRSKNHCQGANQ